VKPRHHPSPADPAAVPPSAASAAVAQGNGNGEISGISHVALRDHDGVDADALRAIAAGLHYLSAHAECPCEPRVAERLVAEAAHGWGGTPQDSWWRWLLGAARSLGLELRVADVSAKDLGVLVRAGTAVVAGPPEDGTLLIVEPGRRRTVRWSYLDGRRDSVAIPRDIVRVVLAGPLHLPSGHAAPRPLRSLWALLRPELKDVGAIVCLSAVAGLLMLSIPVTAQQLVRAVTFASVYQPIVILSLLLLMLLGFTAALQAVQAFVAEVIQRRMFVRTAATVAGRLPHAAASNWQDGHPPELVNRFLEIALVQKIVASLLVDGVSIVLTTLIGMTVMAFYHPFLLGYDVVLLGLLTAVIFGFGRAGVTTAITESKAKYALQAWLEDLARCPSIFRTPNVALWGTQRTDALCAEYLVARRSHFRILLRQIVLILSLQAIATTSLLGLGGYLVLQEQLTLGQLVAAELIVAAIVSSFAKLLKHLESWYDLLASVDKLAHLLGIPLESQQGLIGLSPSGPARLQFPSALPADPLRPGEESLIEVSPGECVALCGWSDADIEQLCSLLRGEASANASCVLIDGIDVFDLRPDVLRSHVVVVRDLEFLDATIAENIHLNRPEVLEDRVLWLVENLGLGNDLRRRRIALTSPMTPSGWPLMWSERLRLVLARTLAGQPRLVFVEHLLDGLAEDELERVAGVLKAVSKHTTILVATERNDIARIFPRRIPGSNWRMAETGERNS
jgi:ABC-type bacteriocin/lantibiotic exporter with double-glycine peptidase domain